MMRSLIRSRSGFTLVELMISLFLTAIAVIAIYRSYVAIRVGIEIHEQQAEIHQNLRIGVQRMARELRMATFDPEGNSEAGFVVANDTSIRFTCDLNDDGDNGDNDLNGDLFADEDVTYSWSGTDGDPLVRSDNNGGTNATIINGVSGLKLIYLTDDNPPELLTKPLSAFEREKIRDIEIVLVARATNSDPNYTNNRTYLSTWDEDNPANGLDSAFPAGNPNPPNDNFRRGRLVTRVKSRNAGLN